MRAQLGSLISAAAVALGLLLPTAPASAFLTVADNSPVAQVAASPAPPHDELAGKLERRVVQRAPLSIAGREIVQVETKIPPGVESGWHVHPGTASCCGSVFRPLIALRCIGHSATDLRG